MAEYISGLLQKSYSTNENVTVNDRLHYNSWDMIKVNANIQEAEKGKDFKLIIDRLYSIATHFCQGGALSQYKKEGERWARELMNHYNKTEVLDQFIKEFNVQGDLGTTSSFAKAMQQTYNTINKVRALNTASGKRIQEQEIQEFERVMTGAVYTGLAVNVSWGSQKEQYSLLANKKNFLDVVNFLRNDIGNKSSFWQSFFTIHHPDKFWDSLNQMNLQNNTLLDAQATQRILQVYPSLAGGVRRNALGAVRTQLSVLSLLLGVGHFSWAVATERKDISSAIDWVKLAVAFTKTTLTLIQLDVFFGKIVTLIYGNGGRIVELVATNINNFSKFISNLVSKGKYLSNVVERQVVTKLFLATSNITRIIQICFVGLAVLSTALAAYSLYEAIVGGDIGDIVFAAINTLIASVALALTITGLIGIATGPLGIVVAVVGILVAIAQWIYGALKKPVIPPSPIVKYTNTYIRGSDLEYQKIGSYICRALTYREGNRVCAFDAKTMNTDWEKIAGIRDDNARTYSEAGALVTSSRTSKIYNFANIKDPKWNRISSFFAQGATQSIAGWKPADDLDRCQHAVESRDKFGRSAAIFLATTKTSGSAKVYLTAHLEDAPKHYHELQFGEWREDKLDVVAINDLDETIFLVVTTQHIYQIKGGVVTKVVSDFVGEPGAKVYAGIITAVALGPHVNLFYKLGHIDAPETGYHYHLTRDDDGNYTNMKLLRTFDKFRPNNSVVGYLFKKTAKLAARMDFIYFNGFNYARYGAIINNNGESSFSLYNGVEFKVPNTGFLYFYKNAFIPS
ncbi:hypothetical protein [Aeromonas cavernicola]|uniref:hypothetical protein n=1 Tax=Aeromonas cavernicola TaxID=1006623 RepID=UPI001F2AB1A8|nr:hypothetical protein [Aeromonas cavernicola]